MRANIKAHKNIIYIFAVFLGWIALHYFDVFSMITHSELPMYMMSLVALIIMTVLSVNSSIYAYHLEQSQTTKKMIYFMCLMLVNYSIVLYRIQINTFMNDTLSQILLLYSSLFLVIGIQSHIKFAHTWQGERHLGKAYFFLRTLGLLLLEIATYYSIENELIEKASFVITFCIVMTGYEVVVLLEMFQSKRSKKVITATTIILIAQILFTISNFALVDFLTFNVTNFIAIMIYYFYMNEYNFKFLNNKNERMQRNFSVYSENLQKIIDKKTLQLREANLKLIEEIDYAKLIQQSLLPERTIDYRDVRFNSGYFPCERLSGDFYDVFVMDENHMGLYFFDVAGHGVSAALMTMLINNYLKSNEQRLWEDRPDRMLKYLFEYFNKLNLPTEMHLVIFYAIYDINSSMLHYCSGGMNCMPILFKRDGTYYFLEESEGIAICKIGEMFTPTFSSAHLKLSHGDRILFYTDGLIDQAKNEILDIDQIIDFFLKNQEMKTDELNETLIRKITPHKDNLKDDITYIIMDI